MRAIDCSITNDSLKKKKKDRAVDKELEVINSQASRRRHRVIIMPCWPCTALQGPSAHNFAKLQLKPTPCYPFTAILCLILPSESGQHKYQWSLFR